MNDSSKHVNPKIHANATVKNKQSACETDITKYQMLMSDLNPCMSIILSSDGQTVDCSATAIEYFEYRSKEELLSNFLPDFLKSIPAFQPDASPTIAFATRIEYVVEYGTHDFEMEITLHAKRVPLRFMLRKVEKEDIYIIVCFILDTQSLKEARNELLRNDLLMRQVNRAATRLLATEPKNFGTTIIRTLKSLAQAVNASQMAILKNFNSDEGEGSRVLYDCDFKGGSFFANNKSSEYTLDYALIPDWHQTLAADKAINITAASLTALGREKLFPRGTKVLIMIPVFLQKNFWGVILAAKSADSHLFTKSEERAIQSGGVISVTAILRNQVSQNLISAREAAKASEKAKSDFLSRMSHEIRTPLNAILGMTAVSKKLDKVEQIKKNLRNVELASSQLLSLVNDILDMSKIEAGKVDIAHHPFDFTMTLQKVIEIHRVSMEEKKQNFSLNYDRQLERYIITDEFRLSQVLINLMGNAIKFTAEGGMIFVSVSYFEAEKAGDSTLRVEVKDNGIGISEEQKQLLFRRFEQADGTITRRFGGSGLGLAICKNIIELLGGNIRVESQMGEGANFIFEIPLIWGDLINDPENAESRHHLGTYCWKDKCILLAEDIEINREVAIALLQDTEIQVTCAENGLEALTLFSQEPDKYSIILMDIQMPIMDGLEASRKIRALDIEKAKTIPIIAMTANAFSDDVQRCLDAGMMGHISKPIDTNIFISRLAEYL